VRAGVPVCQWVFGGLNAEVRNAGGLGGVQAKQGLAVLEKVMEMHRSGKLAQAVLYDVTDKETDKHGKPTNLKDLVPDAESKVERRSCKGVGKTGR
jgi:hypothetical protein